MRAAYRVRLVANLVNGSTLAGLVVAAAGRARLGPGRDGLLIGERYRLPVPPAPAFTLGNVIMTRIERDALLGQEALLAHEARHATQFAWCAGLVMLPLLHGGRGVLGADGRLRLPQRLRAPGRARRRRVHRPAAATGPGPVGGHGPARPAQPGMRFHRLQVLRRLPHPGRGFTQGLILAGGAVWESTGLYGESSLRRYRLGAGEWESCAPLAPELFAEGICLAGETLW